MPEFFSMRKDVNLLVYKLWYGLLNFEFERNYTFFKCCYEILYNIFWSYAALFFLPVYFRSYSTFLSNQLPVIKKILMTVVPNLELPYTHRWLNVHGSIFNLLGVISLNKIDFTSPRNCQAFKSSHWGMGTHVGDREGKAKGVAFTTPC